MAQDLTNIEETIKRAIKERIQSEVEEAFDLKMEELNKRKNEIVAGVVLNIMSYVQFEIMGKRMIVEIKEIGGQKQD